MDGTILNTLTDITNSVNYTFSHFNLKNVTKQEVRQALGNGAKRLIGDLLKKSNHENLNDIVTFYLTHYTANNNINTKPYENIITVLKALKKKYKLAVVSNKSDHLVKKLNDELFDGLFDLSIGEQKGLKIKPNPDMLNYAVNYFNLKKDEVIFIGDSEVDILTGKNALIKVIAVSWGFRDLNQLKDYDPDYIVNKPLELLNII